MADFKLRSLWQFDRLDPKRYRWQLYRVFSRGLGAVLMGLVLAMHLVWPDDMLKVAGAIGASLLAGLLIRFHLRQAPPRAVTPRVAERLLWTTGMIGLLGVQLVLQLRGQEFGPQSLLLLAPIAAQAMLSSALLGAAASLIGVTVTVVLLGSFGALAPELLAMTWFAGAVGAHTVSPLKRRSDLFRALSVQIVAHIILGGVAAVAIAGGLASTILTLGWAALAAIIALSVFWFGVALLERAFGIVSDWTLLELCSPENHLIRELNLKAPGTYAHSVGVGNLAETAAREIGANAILCRAMAYYHDIGKLTRPSYFVENQGDENVHDEMAPTLSAKVISAHVSDGVEMARKAKLPSSIIEGIQQHHGTSLISYFYHRAVEQSDGEAVLEENFRYDGPKPRTKEAAILHLADMVEAASRAVRGRAQLEKVVNSLIDASRADGQLDESDLSFQELRTITESFNRALGALRHERIAYPGQDSDEPGEEESDIDQERIIKAIEA
ncbi:MAG: HDIG domain-containing protein [Armatimonadetes bacterium]|nr:HDIG domain-containing protein [Armatimonadota bacterium]